MSDPVLRTPRKSLTKSQLQEPVALELLALLQTITSDGRLLEEEVQLLKQWLDDNRESALPAIEHLRGAVETVLADGRVSPQECAWLQKAVETVLPREERDLAALRRREAVAEERQLAAEEKERLAEQRAELRRLNRPITRFDVMVAGVLHEGRAVVIERFVAELDTVYLAREPKNPFSPNAIAVRLTNGLDIGYIPETEAVNLAPVLDQGALHSAVVKKILHGRRAPIPVIWGELYASQAQLPDAVSQSQVPVRASAPPAPQRPTRAAPVAVPFASHPTPAPSTDRPIASSRSRWLVVGLIGLALLALWLAQRL